MKIQYLIYGALLITILSCKASKETYNTQKMLQSGFIEGVITTAKTSEDCEYSIQTHTLSYKLDPINLNNAFKKNNIKIWFKYTGLRQKNRCLNTLPVKIIEMKIKQ